MKPRCFSRPVRSQAANNVSSYFNLREINESLQYQNSSLELEGLKLRAQLQHYEEKYSIDSMGLPTWLSQFDYIHAHVINNSTNKPHNYITINKGMKDGIMPEMGVLDQNGVVGIVNVVGENSARIISMLNSNIKLSCKIKGTKNVGSLIWDGVNPTIANLEELPRHSVFKKGDTVKFCIPCGNTRKAYIVVDLDLVMKLSDLNQNNIQLGGE